MLSPVLVIFCCDVVVAAQIESLLFLACLSGNSYNFVCAQSFGKQDSKVSKTTNPRHGDLLARASSKVLERRVHSHATAEHRGGVLRGKPVRNLNHKVRRAPVVKTIAAISIPTIPVYGGVCVDNLGAVVLSIVAAFVAGAITAEARVGLGTNSNHVTDLDATFGLGTDPNGYTNNFVSDNARVGGLALCSKTDVSNLYSTCLIDSNRPGIVF